MGKAEDLQAERDNAALVSKQEDGYIFQPVMKDPADQLADIQRRIDDIKNQTGQPESYVSAFQSGTDDFHVATGNAFVEESDSLRNLLSTPPTIRETDLQTDWTGLLYIGLALGLGFYFFKGKI